MRHECLWWNQPSHYQALNVVDDIEQANGQGYKALATEESISRLMDSSSSKIARNNRPACISEEFRKCSGTPVLVSACKASQVLWSAAHHFSVAPNFSMRMFLR